MHSKSAVILKYRVYQKGLQLGWTKRGGSKVEEGGGRWEYRCARVSSLYMHDVSQSEHGQVRARKSLI